MQMIATLADSAPLFFVLGPRRSGTNFTEVLLEDNFDCRVADLNRNPIKPSRASRPHLMKEFGGKHDITGNTLSAMVDAGGYIVAQSRNPVDWLIARCRYQSLINAETAQDVVHRNMKLWLENEYINFWHTVISKMTDFARERFMLMRYEDAVLHPYAYLRSLSNCFSLPLQHDKPIVPTQEIRPGGGKGERFAMVGNPFYCYQRSDYQGQVAMVKDTLGAELLEFLNYDGY